MKTKTLKWAESVLRDRGLMRKSVLFDQEEADWYGAAIDTRGDCAGRIFFALKGEKTDGHQYVVDSFSRGCVAVVIDNEEFLERVTNTDSPCFLVRDSLEALQELSRAYRDTLDVRVVAITGSTGKTTTKEFIRMILRKKYRIHSNPGNFNNHIGVPLTILENDRDNEYLVSEVAANHTGEIEFLAGILRPDIGVITNIGDAHLGYFGTRKKVAEAKGELLGGIEAEGCAVLPGDDEYYEFLRGLAGCRVWSFGVSNGCAFRIGGISDEGDLIRFEVNGEPLAIKSVGLYNVLNAAAAFAVGDLCGVEPDLTREALLEMEPMPGRGKVIRERGVVLIDDSYNANPTSMRAALETLSRIAGKRKIAVLGDMAELGKYTEVSHQELGEHLAGLVLDGVFWLGENGIHVKKGIEKKRTAHSKAVTRFTSYDGADPLVESLGRILRPGDVVLVKGSRVGRLDEVVDGLRKKFLHDAEE